MRIVRYLQVIAAGFGLMGGTALQAQDSDFAFALVDGNHDSVISRDEASGFAAMQWRGLDPRGTGQVGREAITTNPQARSIVGDMIPVGSASLSREAFSAGFMNRFGKADQNQDGMLDAGEFRILLGMPPQAVRATTTVMLPSLATEMPAGLPACAALATDPKAGLAGKAGVTALSAKVVPANAVDAPYCQVQFTWDSGKAGPKDGYDEGQRQAIGIRIGLPLRADDGGKLLWNGRIQNVGSGGCMGLLPNVTAATNGGFASASTDGGHGAPWIAFNCGFGVIQGKQRLNEGLIRDFSAEHVRWQTFWSKALVRTYYGQEAHKTYWCGCSQGGREGFIAAQVVPDQYDGILAGAAALYWQRFQMAQAWSGLVIKDMLRSKGKDLTPLQIAQTVDQEVAACDMLDGIKDGELADPRQCHWSAKAAICGVATAHPGKCLDADQAAAFDTVRRGPFNGKGQRIWYPWEPGTTFSNQTDYLLSDGIMQWATRDLGFKSDAHLYMDKAALQRSGDAQGITYEDMATLATQSTSDLADVSDPALDRARRSGVKILAWTGTADRNIQSRNTLKYYHDVAAHFGRKITDEDVRGWFRVFLFPGVDHCQGGVGAQPGSIVSGPLFQTLVAWVERGTAPERIIATKMDMATGALLRTRVACAYPKTAIYDGKGNPNDAGSFRCGGNLDTPAVLADAQVAPIKMENGTGQIPANYHREKQ